MTQAPSRPVAAQSGERGAVRASGDLDVIRLGWQEVPGATAYYVRGVAWSGPGAARRTTDEPLAVVQQPRFVHTGHGPLAVRWSYSVAVIVDGQERLVGTASAASRTSVTLTGTPVAKVGSFDGSGAELALTPEGFVHYRSTFPRDVDFRYGADRDDRTWSCLQPGPEDAWAGRQQHRFRLRFDLTHLPSDDLDLAIWLVDHALNAGSINLSLNDDIPQTVFFEDPAASASLGSGRPAGLGGGAGPAFIERALDRSLLRVGENTIDIINDHGSWIAYDALGVFERPQARV